MKFKYYHLSTCEVEVAVEDNVFAQKLNVLHITTSNRIGVSDMGDIQQKASLTYLKQLQMRGLDPSKVMVRDVVILNICPLGTFTDKEWEESMPAAARAAKREEQGKPNLTVVGSEPANEG